MLDMTDAGLNAHWKSTSSCSIQQSSCYSCYTEDMCFVNNGLADKTSTEPGLDDVTDAHKLQWRRDPA